ncbi:hypothetical protein BDZ45DRAFT_731749 [Acephala macrosclerotiorum]|nr:hypothetical protein BDZ45DRAFT_731749 [Acephala macrosclerotiorum]
MPPAQVSELPQISATESRDTTNGEDVMMLPAQDCDDDPPQAPITNSKDSTDGDDLTLPEAQTSQSSAVAQLAGLPAEIWTLVAKQIHGPRTFLQLIKVSRIFHDIFLPFLYPQNSLRLSREDDGLPKWVMEPLPNSLEYAKHLKITLEGVDDSSIPHANNTHDSYAALVMDIIKRMPNMRSFQWVNNASQDPFITPLILRNEDLLTTLKGLPLLRKISIFFLSEPQVGSGSGMCWTDLSGFRNLTSLELYNFRGDEKRLVRDISGLLHDNPGLRKLGLGMACGEDPRAWLQHIIIAPEKQNLLEELCMEYSTTTRGTAPPLSLETLRLGHGLSVLSPTSPESVGYLSRLVRTDQLAILHLCNGYTVQDPDDTDLEAIAVDWSVLGPCSSLRQLSVTLLSRECKDWLNSSCIAMEELLVTETCGGRHDPDLWVFDSLRLPKLSMIVVGEHGTQNGEDHRDSDSDSDSSESGSYAAASDSQSEFGEELGGGSGGGSDPEKRGATESESESESESDSSPDASSKANILDRLHDGGRQLTRLSLCLDAAGWPSFAGHLPKLKHLTQLRLSRKVAHRGQTLTAPTALWPNVTDRFEIARRYAQTAKSLCPSLQYIRVENWAWQITGSEGIRHLVPIYMISSSFVGYGMRRC